jgi:hypothetical protein
MPFPTERPRNPLPPYSYGLFYKVCRSICYSRPRGFDSGGRSSYQFLLPLRDTPRITHSDQGRNFESRLLQENLQRLGVNKTCTNPLHPQSDGMVERYIRTVQEHLRKAVASNQKAWDAKLPHFLLAYRASTHDVTGFTPASLLFGRELRLHSAQLFGTSPRQGASNNRACCKPDRPSA